jgi:hypothetical protein
MMIRQVFCHVLMIFIDKLFERVIHEEIEKEDKNSSCLSEFSEERKMISPVVHQIQNAFLDSEGTDKRRVDTDPLADNERLPIPTKTKSTADKGKNESFKLKHQLKRSTTTKQEEGNKSPKIKRKISHILRSVDRERKLYSKANNGIIDNVEDGHKITEYRRKGMLKQRRLSRINLGKQLALSETSGLKLQWIVDYKDNHDGLNNN